MTDTAISLEMAFAVLHEWPYRWQIVGERGRHVVLLWAPYWSAPRMAWHASLTEAIMAALAEART